MKLAIVGCTGLVGTVILTVLKEKNISFSELILVASSKSIGKKIECNGEDHNVVSIEDASEPLAGSLSIKQPIVRPSAILVRYWDC